ncbi:uncharacterized protein LOC113564620 [Drosophila erecta]|uniref:uncharacterized protein LOC113564620 n=1 Tax=Drosophila erecta TaxID=7220 RepID=UPI000F05E0F0|nr:uncharacterized protein LOC113564620 [Drosophila erecta]
MGERGPTNRQKATWTNLLSQKQSTNSISSKYIVILRNNDTDKQYKLSPFAFKNNIDYTCDGEVIFCRALQSGDLLVKNKNTIQADKLLKMSNFTNDIPVTGSEHRTLNSSSKK